jgi:hypothetical protein
MSAHYDMKTLLLHAKIDTRVLADEIATDADIAINTRDSLQREARTEFALSNIVRLRDACDQILLQAEKAKHRGEAA